MSGVSHHQKLMSLLQQKLAECIEVDYELMSASGREAQLLILKAFEVKAEEMGDIAGSVGLKGLSLACLYMRNNFQLLSTKEVHFSTNTIALIQSWAVPLSAYCHCIGHGVEEDEAVDVILDFLSDSAWPSPLAIDAQEEIKRLFSEPFDLDSDVGAIFITEEMAALSIPSDVEGKIVTDFLSELSYQVEAFDCAIEQYVITEDSMQLRVAQRIAHTIKGAANIVGVRGVAYLMHYVEDILNLPTKEIQADDRLGFVLQDSADCLSVIAEFLSGLGPKPEGVRSVIQSVVEFLRGQDVTNTELSFIAVDGVESTMGAKSFHLENLIAFNDPGLKTTPPAYHSEVVSIDFNKGEEPSSKEEGGDAGFDEFLDGFNDSDIESALEESHSLGDDEQKGALDDALFDALLEGDTLAAASSITEAQKHDLIDLAGEAQKGNAQILYLIDELILSVQALDSSSLALHCEDNALLLKRAVLSQSQIGLSLRKKLSDVCMLPQGYSHSSDETKVEGQPEELNSKPTLIVSVGGVKACVLSASLERIFYVEQSKLLNDAEGMAYQLIDDQEPLPVVTFNGAFFPESVKSSVVYGAMVITKNDLGERFGVLVESIVSSENQVIRPLGELDQNIPGVVGSSILDDGSESLVVDLQQLPSEVGQSEGE